MAAQKVGGGKQVVTVSVNIVQGTKEGVVLAMHSHTAVRVLNTRGMVGMVELNEAASALQFPRFEPIIAWELDSFQARA